MYTRCIDGKGNRTTHEADGWLCCPNGRQIAPMCRRHAQECIDEYTQKLGETWTFRPVLDALAAPQE